MDTLMPDKYTLRPTDLGSPKDDFVSGLMGATLAAPMLRPRRKARAGFGLSTASNCAARCRKA